MLGTRLRHLGTLLGIGDLLALGTPPAEAARLERRQTAGAISRGELQWITWKLEQHGAHRSAGWESSGELSTTSATVARTDLAGSSVRANGAKGAARLTQPKETTAAHGWHDYHEPHMCAEP